MRPVLRCVGGVCFGLTIVFGLFGISLLFVAGAFDSAHEWCIAKHNRIGEDRRALSEGGAS